MKIPLRLKTILRKTPGVTCERHKRGFLLTASGDVTLVVDIGQVVSLEQWEALERQVRALQANKAGR